jgi:hypothetical protein
MGPHSDTRKRQGRRRRKKLTYNASSVEFSLAWEHPKNGTEIYQQTQPTGRVASSTWVSASSILWCGLKLGRERWGKLPSAILQDLPEFQFINLHILDTSI